MKTRNPHELSYKVITTRPDGSRRVVSVLPGKSATDRSQAPQCDINNIMKKYSLTGQISHMAKNPGAYGDFTALRDLSTAVDTVQAANELFMEIPSHVRERFLNDPRYLVKFLENPANDAEAVRLGLKIAPPTPASEDIKNQVPPSKQKGKQKTEEPAESE